MIPKKGPRTDCVFLLLSWVNYHISLPSLWEKERKRRQYLWPKCRRSPFLVGGKPFGCLRGITSLYTMVHVLDFPPFYGFSFSFLLSGMSQLSLSGNWLNVLSSHQQSVGNCRALGDIAPNEQHSTARWSLFSTTPTKHPLPKTHKLFTSSRSFFAHQQTHQDH